MHEQIWQHLLPLLICPKAHGRVALIIGSQVLAHCVLELILCPCGIARPAPSQYSILRVLSVCHALCNFFQNLPRCERCFAACFFLIVRCGVVQYIIGTLQD